MDFHRRNYDVYVLLGHPGKPPLWQWPVWAKAVAALTPLLSLARGKPSVRSVQTGKGGKSVPFGPLGWDEASHRKWTHVSSGGDAKPADRRFGAAEVWAPAWGICAREDQAPEVFLSVTNESEGAAFSRPPSFNPFVVLAVAADRDSAMSTLGREVATTLAGVMNATLAVHRRRPWGVGDGDGFTRALQDISSADLFRGDPHGRPPTIAGIRSGWTAFAEGGRRPSPRKRRAK